MKTGIQKTELEMHDVNTNNEVLQKEVASLKDQLNTFKQSYHSLEQDFNRLSIETYNLLYNIRHKFENNPKLTQSLNM